MPTSSFSSQGSKIQVSITAVFTDIPGVKGLTVPTQQWEFDDVTNLSSENNLKEYSPIVKDPGEISFDMVLANPPAAAQTHLRTANENGTLQSFKIIQSDSGAAEWAFSAYVASYQVKMETNRAAMVTVTLKPTGNITYTA